MFVDIVFNKDNEVMSLSKKLGFSNIYTIEKYNNNHKANFVLLEADELNKIKEVSKQYSLVFVDDSNNLTRAIIENKDVDCLVMNENTNLNQVILKIMQTNKVFLVIPFNKILNSGNNLRIKILNKIKNAIKLARKYKVKIIVCSFASNIYELRSLRDLISFNVVMGMTGKEAKEAFSNLDLTIK